MRTACFIYLTVNQREKCSRRSGAVFIKRLSDAVRDGDRIYGVIKAVSVNNDGRTLGPGSPNIRAQRDAIQTALDMAEKSPEDIGYIEVNGGGSQSLIRWKSRRSQMSIS